MTCRKLRTGESEQRRTKIAEGRSFVHLVMRPIFRSSNIICIIILFLLIVKTNNTISLHVMNKYI